MRSQVCKGNGWQKDQVRDLILVMSVALMITHLWNYLLPKPLGPLYLITSLPSGMASTTTEHAEEFLSWEGRVPTLSVTRRRDIRLHDLGKEKTLGVQSPGAILG